MFFVDLDDEDGILDRVGDDMGVLLYKDTKIRLMVMCKSDNEVSKSEQASHKVLIPTTSSFIVNVYYYNEKKITHVYQAESPRRSSKKKTFVQDHLIRRNRFVEEAMGARLDDALSSDEPLSLARSSMSLTKAAAELHRRLDGVNGESWPKLQTQYSFGHKVIEILGYIALVDKKPTVDLRHQSRRNDPWKEREIIDEIARRLKEGGRRGWHVDCRSRSDINAVHKMILIKMSELSGDQIRHIQRLE